MLLTHLKLALRQIRRNPGYFTAVILTLALAIGVNTAVFTMLDGFLFRHLPYPQRNHLAMLAYRVEHTEAGKKGSASEFRSSVYYKTWEAVKDHVPSVTTAVMGESFGHTEGVDLDTGTGQSEVARYVKAAHVSAHYFQVLGIEPMLGRGFTQAEDSPGAGKAVVISYALWNGLFHKDPHLLGSTIQLKGTAYTVVGIMPPHVLMPHPAQVWIPLMPSNPHGWCGGTNCEVLMRLKPHATWQQARAQLAHVPKPAYLGASVQTTFYPESMQKYMGGSARSPIELLMLAVAFILLIACANLAGLAMVRITRRTPEIATRLALGASTRSVLFQQWLESLALSAVGTLAGLGLAWGILQPLPRILPASLVPLGGFHLDSRVLLFAVCVTLFTSILFGALPALQVRKIDVQRALASGNRTLAGGTGRLRQWLIGGQVALTVVLLAGAGLLVRTVIYLETLPPGFNPQHVLVAKASLDDAHYEKGNSLQGLLDRSLAAIRKIPGVKDAAFGLSVPYETMLNDYITIPDGKRAGMSDSSSLAFVTPDYFSTLKIPLLSGRDFLHSDTATSEPVAVVNAAFGRHFFGTPDPIGMHIREGGKTLTIVGVVANVLDQSRVSQSAPIGTEPIFYVPATQVSPKLLALIFAWAQPDWIVRTQVRSAEIQRAIQRAMGSVAPDLPISGFYSMNSLMHEQLKTQRMEVLLLGSLAMLALLLSAIGIYALVSNLVVQRTREIGIPAALGSPWKRVIVAVGLPGMTAALGGVCVGLVASFFALRVLKSAIYGIHDLDPVTLTLVPLLLIALAAAASIIPSLRVTRIDPAQTLREG